MKKKSSLKKYIYFYFTFLISCQSKEISKVKELKSNNLDQTGIYQAKLKSINPEISKYLNGSLAILIEKNLLHASVRFSQGPVDSIHEQAIYSGERCPETSDDLNGDGFIDSKEANLIIKEKLIPLDDDLSSQRMGSGIYPKSDAYGSYFWGRKVIIESLINDLKDEDLNLEDDLKKIKANEELRLENLIFVIRGIPPEIQLPETVNPIGKQNIHESLPIACGEIRRISNVPGEIDHDRSSRDYSDNETPREDGADFPDSDSNEGEDYGTLTIITNEFL
jgi:hypothetical protein